MIKQVDGFKPMASYMKKRSLSKAKLTHASSSRSSNFLMVLGGEGQFDKFLARF